MKNKFLLFLLLILSANFVFGQDFHGIKILINPGHGGHDPANDRYIPATGFWESDGNVAKGLLLRDIMKAYGAEVIMSRVTNNDADDLPLSQIVSMANDNNVLHMHSIHSNAAGSTSFANYTLILYQGFDLLPTYPASRTMATAIGNEIFAAHRDAYLTIRGDADFYGTGKPYLGVFKGLNMPGTLSEGSFHDYVPESWRLMNDSYRKHEAWAIAKGFIQFWGKAPFNHGLIAGIVRDPEAKVDYTWISSQPLDALKPVNNVKITLQPGNKVYNGDSMNNGFFMFDSLAPGQYKLYYEAAGYMSDSAAVTVEANKNTFADMYLQVYSTVVPRVTSFTPNAQQDSVKAIDPIKISFNIPMLKSAFEQSVKFTPEAKLSFTWENNFRAVTVKPAVPFEKGTKYTVTIPANVKSVSNISSDTTYSFSFTTKNRNKLTILSNFPVNGQTDVSSTPQVRIQFDVPLLNSTLTGNVNLYGPNNEKLVIANTKVFTQDGRGNIYFEPSKPLQTNADFRIELGAKIGDANGYNLVDTVKINFRTYYEKYVSGTIIDSLETQSRWGLTSGNGYDQTASKFELATDKKMSGQSSGKLTYAFTGDSLGFVRVPSIAKPSLLSIKDLGMWIYGDLSNNRLSYLISSNTSSDTNYVYGQYTGPINWAGWKFVKTNLNILSKESSSNIKFEGVEIAQSKTGLKTGAVYFDDVQYNIVTPVEGKENAVHPVRFALEQNYPNPFNPATTINYSIAENSFVSLKIFDMLGREVASLVNEQQNAGNYKASFNASMLTSGIYIYKLSAGKFTESRKMSLIK